MRPLDAPPRGWSSVPRPLADTTVSTAKGSTLSYYGYVFEVPWNKIEHEWDDGWTVRIRFGTGQTIILNNPEYFPSNPIGPDIPESKYEQCKAIVSTIPSQWSPFRSHREFARVRRLLEIKGAWFEHNTAAPDIFSFSTNYYRGFEFSGLSHDWQHVTVNFFDTKDRWLQINILGDAGNHVRLTQSEINRLIQSFRSLPSAQTRQRN